MKPIETTNPITFTHLDRTFQRLKPNNYIELKEDGTKAPITKESNVLMDALMGGEITSITD